MQPNQNASSFASSDAAGNALLPAGPELFRLVFEFGPDAMVIVDGEGRVALVNVQLERIFGYRRDELIGQAIEILIPQRFVSRHVEYRTAYAAAPYTRSMGAGGELFGRRKDGTEFPVDIILSPLSLDRGNIIVAGVRDISERLRDEAQDAHRQEVLLQGIHHRVKNDLQIISSLLYLQSIAISHPKVQAILDESRARIRSIALIHEKLSRAGELARVDFAEYVRDLIADLYRAHDISQDTIRLSLDIADVVMGIEKATPCGLIINELVANALKHAFPGGKTGTLAVEFSRGGDGFLLKVSDDGLGLPSDFDWEALKSMGLRLVKDLTTQLAGTIAIDRTQGTAISISFNEMHFNQREQGHGAAVNSNR
jgi:PAS domain S-box-containing protein